MTLPEVSITFTRYREPDWLVDEALDSLAAQEGIAGEVIFLDQNWSEAFAKTVETRSNDRLAFRCVPCEERGLSFARNRGISIAKSDFVVQLDPDVVVKTDCVKTLVSSLIKHDAALAGTRILPRWRGHAPLLAKSKIILDQYSMLDWGEVTKPTIRIVGAGYALNRKKFSDAIVFDENFGRRQGVLFGGAESQLCRRLVDSGEKIIYVGGAIVWHQVLPERLTWRWVLKRLYFAGAARRQQGGAPSPSKGPGLWDWLLLPIILPPYALGYWRAPKPEKS